MLWSATMLTLSGVPPSQSMVPGEQPVYGLTQTSPIDGMTSGAKLLTLHVQLAVPLGAVVPQLIWIDPLGERFRGRAWVPRLRALPEARLQTCEPMLRPMAPPAHDELA